MKVFFSVGEPSGDLHGANLIRDLRNRNPALEAVGFGGPKMRAEGCGLLYDLTSLAVMGIVNVLRHVRKFFVLLAEADQYFEKNPDIDAVVLIDFPGFNWWIARKAKKRGIPVFYYGVPQMWAWLPWRVKKLRRLVDHVLCKLPFEVPWFQRRGCQAAYVGHPYFDEVVRFEYDQDFMSERLKDRSCQRLVLLPGSRNQEVKRNLPVLLESANEVLKTNPQTVISVACFKKQHLDFITQCITDSKVPANVFVRRTPELISTADVCIACSGSVSLELLYHRKPTVIVYKTTAIVMLLQTFLLRTRFITLVNMLGRERIEKSGTPKYNPNDPGSNVVMPEYLGWRLKATDVAAWVQRWLNDQSLYREKVSQMDTLAQQFAHPGASEKAATLILDVLERNLESKGEVNQANSDVKLAAGEGYHAAA